jgi:hypothetical protein
MRGVVAIKIRRGVLLALVALLGATGVVDQVNSESSAASSFWPPDVNPELSILNDFERPPACVEKEVKIPKRDKGNIVFVPTVKCFNKLSYGYLSTDRYLMRHGDHAYKLIAGDSRGHRPDHRGRRGWHYPTGRRAPHLGPRHR